VSRANRFRPAFPVVDQHGEMSDGLISLLLLLSALVSVALIVALPEGWLLRATSRLRRNKAPEEPGRSPNAGGEHRLLCSECGGISLPRAVGWKAYLTLDDEPLFLCPVCAESELRGSNDHFRRGPTE
jgi:hypothetical protein